MSHSQYTTSYGSYNNYGQHLSGPGSISNHFDLANPLQDLHAKCSFNALFDAGVRYERPPCSRSTRLEIIKRIRAWIDSDSYDAMSLFWLFGGAGVGKSTLAQSLAEISGDNLAASFFFFGGDISRNNGDSFIPTLVFQFVKTFEGLGPFVEDKIRSDPSLLTKQHHIQILNLLIEPLLKLSCADYNRSTDSLPHRPRFILIDGLDECRDSKIQCELLRAIGDAIPHLPYPLRFFISSRPESHIENTLNHDPAFQSMRIHRYNLSMDPDADKDIRRFLEGEFENIHASHCLRQYLPPGWPGPRAIDILVERSSQHFIYGSIVIKYIQSHGHHPDERLQVILSLSSHHNGDRPYAQLDELFKVIFKSAGSRDKLEKVCLVLGILYIQTRPSGIFREPLQQCRTIENFLDMKTGDLVLLLNPLLSLVNIDDDDKVQIYHKGLFDYLIDPSRRGDLPFDLGRVHEAAANYILKHKINPKSCTIVEFGYFAYHCRFGCLNPSLKDYIQSLEVPYDSCIVTPSSWSYVNIFIHSVSNFFVTLSRKDFDPTGRYHKQYTAKWLKYLNSDVVSGIPRIPSGGMPVWAALRSTKENVKDRLDSLLRTWKPQNFNPTDLECNIPSYTENIAAIKREHEIFSAYVKASSRPEGSKIVVSSLVFGEHFTHSYHLQGIKDYARFLILRTYAGHNSASHLLTYDENCSIHRRTLRHLEDAQKLLFSVLYQNCGIIPEDIS